MSYTTATTSSFDVAARMHSLIEGFRANRAQKRAERQTYNELAAMSDRDLADIGVARGEIRHIAAQAGVLR
ncbi:protein of unknown function [Sulfitobacter marinus]|uniref:YjiS-like domain-containing protein n=1 Tax=Sulfitobacter marinus TaxID=394264 RepID=A0A1I6QQA3_9RHOB|nr:DUF1127 domain-containing protein [Sulfitobacter marinus]SFS54575.1 protein of unknown function [Sulfitobacter marinus]